MTGERLRRPPDPTLASPAPGRPSRVRLTALLAGTPLLRLAVARYAVPPGEPDRFACPRCVTPLGLDRPWPALGPAGRRGGGRARRG
ncbi:prepilin peptidase, partial [Micromonospora harpali]